MKINLVDGEPSQSGKDNIRLVWYRWQVWSTRGTFIPAGNFDIECKEDKKVTTQDDKDRIIVVRQPTKLKTAFILFHELCHWFVHLIFRHNCLARRKWHDKIDKYL